jgi:Clostripain family
MLVVAILLLQAASVSAEGLCYLSFQMSDNNLHSLIVGDSVELTKSELIRDPTVTTWIFSDGSPSGPKIPGVLFDDGSPVPEDDGVRYIYWDHAMNSLARSATLGEQDSDSIDNYQAFLATAISDCVAKGRSEYMLILSSHGSGFSFGGDDDQGRRRKLMAVNQDIVTAIERALGVVEGAPEKFDLIGFNACLQGSLESLKDYQSVTRYYMGSEALVPGTGTFAFRIKLGLIPTHIFLPFPF